MITFFENQHNRNFIQGCSYLTSYRKFTYVYHLKMFWKLGPRITSVTDEIRLLQVEMMWCSTCQRGLRSFSADWWRWKSAVGGSCPGRRLTSSSCWQRGLHCPCDSQTPTQTDRHSNTETYKHTEWGRRKLQWNSSLSGQSKISATDTYTVTSDPILSHPIITIQIDFCHFGSTDFITAAISINYLYWSSISVGGVAQWRSMTGEPSRPAPWRAFDGWLLW